MPRPTMPRLVRIALTGCALVVLLAACEPSEFDGGSSGDPNQAAFVTRLGADTLAVERFTRTESGMQAEVVLRTPRTTLRHYDLELGPDGAFQRMTVQVEDPSAADGEALVREDVFTLDGDSLMVETTAEGETETRTVEGHAGMLPFIDMVHWPFELMLVRARASGEEAVSQDLMTGGRSFAFEVRDLEADSMTVTHPFRGTMEVDVDAEGRLVALDAGATTRKLIVERKPWGSVDVDQVARSFAARDEAGASFGELSGRGEAVATVGGATITVDYGRPSKRGREIFGALVPWNELWRTGANQATHFETDQALTLGDLDVPAGTYTLYTIPAPDGGILIVNRQTGQGGTTYNEDQDLGRVPMTRTEVQESVEAFTFEVEETGPGTGVLRLVWDRDAFEVPITVAVAG